MGPLAQLFAMLQRRQDMEDQMPMRQHQGMLEPESVFAPRRGIGPRPFRDPEQMGPEPPVQGPLAVMTKGRY